MALVITAILIQEVLPGGNRTAYIGLTLGAILMFIHYTEFARLATDDYIHRQQVALDTDPLTGVHSRYAYSRMLKEYDISGGLPDSFAAFTIDINGLKRVNDSICLCWTRRIPNGTYGAVRGRGLITPSYSIFVTDILFPVSKMIVNSRMTCYNI